MADNFKVPEPTATDAAVAIAKSVLGELPGGGVVAELWGRILPGTFERRNREWKESLAEGLGRLLERPEITPESLSQNETFIDMTIRASRAAFATGNKEKREALRNAILNSALPNAPEESEQQIYVDLVDRMTVWHLKVLAMFDDPPTWFAKHRGRPVEQSMMTSLHQIMINAFEELKPREEFCRQLWGDLRGYGLVKADSIMVMLSGDSGRYSQTSHRGKAFVKFIADPAV